MKQIPPKERFSHNQRSINISPDLPAEAAALFGMDPKRVTIKSLSGGFMNANFLASDSNQQVVIRVYSSDMKTAQREHDMLEFLKPHPVSTPDVKAILEVQQRPVTVLEYIQGESLENRLLRNQPLDLGVFEDIGNQLGYIHSITFPEAGFIGPGVKIGREYESFSIFAKQFVEKTLKYLETRIDKLDLGTNKRLRKLVHDKWEIVLSTEPVFQLVHTDFNPKNIMVSHASNPKVTAILDWEFSLVGNGLLDLGNFFRFAYDYPEHARERFVKGYQQTQPHLPPNWEDAARLLDLGNMCSFLERPEDYQETFRTARIVIEATLDHFGY